MQTAFPCGNPASEKHPFYKCDRPRICKHNRDLHLLCGTRFDKYTFYHRNKLGDTKYCHKQFRCGELEYGIARCLTHAFYKEIGIDFTHEDWKKISADALKYKLLTNEK